MLRSRSFLAPLMGGVLLCAGSALAQIYSPYPTSPPPGYRAYPQATQRGYYANPDDDAWRQDDVDPAPRQRPRATARRAVSPTRDRDYVDDYLSGPSTVDPIDIAPRVRERPARVGRAKPDATERYAALPPDADPAYSTAVDYDSEVDESQHTRRVVADPTAQGAGVITINTKIRKLYLSLGDGRAIEYGVGVGREGFLWKGSAQIGRKAFWPGWTPPPEMLLRRPELPRHMDGGMENPLGARALYLFKGAKDTLFRIHGTNEPDTIGHAVSSGCIRMMNADVMDLYQRVQKGAKVVVL